MGYKTYTCPIGRTCGGCEWLAVPYPIQLRRKQEWTERLFEQIAQEDKTEVAPIAGVPGDPIAYRCKAATPFAPGPHGRVRSGFYAAGTHRIVACDSCLVEDPRCRRILNEVARTATKLRIPAYDEDRGTGVLRHAIVRVGWKTDEALLTIVTNGRELRHADQFVDELRRRCPEVTSYVQNVNTRKTNAMLGRETHVLWGSGTLHDELLGCTFEIGPTSFYQTNPAQTETLYRLAIEAAALTDGDRLLDAYCGCGTIGICAAAAARETGARVHVTGVETSADGVARARRNAAANRLKDACDFHRADATAWMTETHERFNVVVLDPPRAGSTPAFLEGAARLGPERIVYVSCNAETQVRDLAVLRDAGYRLARLTPVDMFPHTKHVETVVLLTRKLSNAKSIVVEIDTDTLKAEKKPPMATYANMRKWIREELGLKVSAGNIAMMKDEMGLEKQFSYEDAEMAAEKRPGIPEEKRQAIIKAFEHFELIKPKKDKG